MCRSGQLDWTRRGGGRRLLGAFVTLVLTVGCTHSLDPSPPSTPAAQAAESHPDRVTLLCDDPIGGANSAPTSPAKLILGTVALGEFPHMLPAYEDGNGPTLFGKAGLWIHAGHRATLSVASTKGAEILWRTNNPGPTAPTVDIPACPATDLGSWLVYPGGFYVSTPSCVALTVIVGKHSETVHVPVGRTCPS
jgi:hypothetical protein